MGHSLPLHDGRYPRDAATGMPQAMFDTLYTSAYVPMPNAKVKRIDGSPLPRLWSRLPLAGEYCKLRWGDGAN